MIYERFVRNYSIVFVTCRRYVLYVDRQFRQEVPISTIRHFSPTSGQLQLPNHKSTNLTMVSPSLARMTGQVHITGLPMPKNLSESKLVLAALQKFGEVITYRNLKVRRPLLTTS